jgi:peptidoglycan/LPS O-acetylase OafA/YrhL
MLADFLCGDVGHIYELFNFAILLPFIVWIGTQTEAWKPARRIYAWLGRTSYAIYIVHLPLFPLWIYVSNHFVKDIHAHLALTVAAYTLLSLTVAWMLDIFYDIPVRAWLGRKLMPGRHLA